MLPLSPRPLTVTLLRGCIAMYLRCYAASMYGTIMFIVDAPVGTLGTTSAHLTKGQDSRYPDRFPSRRSLRSSPFLGSVAHNRTSPFQEDTRDAESPVPQPVVPKNARLKLDPQGQPQLGSLKSSEDAHFAAEFRDAGTESLPTNPVSETAPYRANKSERFVAAQGIVPVYTGTVAVRRVVLIPHAVYQYPYPVVWRTVNVPPTVVNVPVVVNLQPPGTGVFVGSGAGPAATGGSSFGYGGGNFRGPYAGGAPGYLPGRQGY